LIVTGDAYSPPFGGGAREHWTMRRSGPVTRVNMVVASGVVLRGFYWKESHEKPMNENKDK